MTEQQAAASSCCATSTRSASPAITHPLQPLTPDEIRRVSDIVLRHPPYEDAVRFETIELLEPSKEEVRVFKTGMPIRRRARVNVSSARRVSVTRMTIDLASGEILTRKVLEGQRPMIQLEQFLVIEGLVRADPGFIAACAKRGITDMEQVCVDPWSAGTFGIPGEEGRFLSHVFCWLRLKKNEAFYAHPIEGLNAVIDLNSGKVIRIDDYGITPIPMTEYNYEREFLTEFQPPAKPINVVQPEGVNFTFDGPVLKWRNWSLVVGFNARESLTLHDIRFDGRPVVHRASIVEMTVPYGSPDGGHFRKNVFDVGEYGVGKLANSLRLGCDCLGVIQYLDAHLNKIDGTPWTIENAICVHEEDAGLAWKHTDFRTERVESRRNSRLVVSTICTVGNYEYGFYWYFYLDGTIEHEVKATGVINTAACIPGNPGKYAREVAPGLIGHIHQHILCARLDMAVDGDRNSFVECNTYAEPLGPANPYGNAFYEQETVLKRESEAARRADPASMRYWKVVNPNKKNRAGSPVGYKLHAPHTVTPFVHPESPSGQRMGFTQNHVWVTAFDPEERYPSGEFLNHSDGSGDIRAFVAKNRPIENTDIVLWHVFGLHHPVRIEDFPVQPCVMTGFKLMPFGFFDGNPTINLAPEVNAASSHAKADSSCCD